MRHQSKIIPSFARAAVLGLSVLIGACGGFGGPPSMAPIGSPTAPAHAPSASPSSPHTETPPTSGVSGAANATPLPAKITEAQAIAAVRAFVPHASGLHVTESDTVSAGPSYRVESPDVVAEVDQATGEVRMLLDNVAMPTTSALKVTKDEAQAAAVAWLATHGISTSGLSPTTTLLDHGSSQEYVVVFAGRVNGARIPHRVDVSINPATGAVFAFVVLTHSFVTPPTPKLTVDQALAAAREEEADAGATLTSTDLAIDFDAAGGQVLVYELDLTRTDGFYVKVQVNALTGAVTVMGRG